jgi:hypothetical protein
MYVGMQHVNFTKTEIFLTIGTQINGCFMKLYTCMHPCTYVNRLRKLIINTLSLHACTETGVHLIIIHQTRTERFARKCWFNYVLNYYNVINKYYTIYYY